MMDMNAFDDNLKHRAGGFRIEPRKEVWERVEQELDSKKRKRRILWFWWFVPLLLAGGSTWFLLNPGETKGKLPADQQTGAPIVSMEKAGTAPQASAPATGGQLKTGITGIENETNRTNHTTTQHTTPNTHSSSGRGVALPARPPVDAPHRTPAPPAQANQKIEPVLAGNPQTETTFNSSIGMVVAQDADTLAITPKSTEIQQEAKSDSVNNREQDAMVPATDKKPETDSQAVVLQNAPVDKKERKPSRGNWILLAGTGLHNHTSKGLTLEKSMADYNGGLSNNAGGGQGGQLLTLESPKPGWGFMLGIERNQPFGKSKHWSWTGGLHYQYQSFTISTGALKDSALNYYTDRGNVTTTGFYRAGNSVKQKGSQHRMHLLAAIQWHMDKKQRWTWQNGFYGGLILSSDYLIPQRAPVGWVSSNGLIHKGYAGIETGIQFRPSPQWGAGIYGQYNLTNSLNISGPAPQYWRGVELRIQYKLSSNALNK